MLDPGSLGRQAASATRRSIKRQASAFACPHRQPRRLAGGCELIIDHTGAEYRLRLTRNGKPILTK